MSKEPSEPLIQELAYSSAAKAIRRYTVDAKGLSMHFRWLLPAWNESDDANIDEGRDKGNLSGYE
jgi:hypothetical protein